MNKDVRVIDCKASDNKYLHKDFHGALCYAIKYLDDNFCRQATEEYLRQVADTYFAPLMKRLKEKGLSALESHWQEVFSKEGGEFKLYYDDNVLILEVAKCPAISHLKKRGMLFTNRFCRTTVVINQAICKKAGFECSCRYEHGQGKCVQRFWKELD